MNDVLKTADAIVNGTADKELLNNNANKASERVPVMKNFVAGEVAKVMARQMLDDDILSAHDLGYIHFHDMDESPFYPMYNCFSRSTSFITTTGVKSFNDFNDGDVVYVPSHTGEIRKAVVKYYGTQQMFDITFKRGRGTRTVTATSNHRWLTTEGETTNLSVGDKLIHAPDLSDFDAEPLMFCLGFAYGDGVMNGEYLRLRLCGKKTKYAPMFELCGFNVTYPPSLGGDASVILLGHTKRLPKNGECVRSFVKGYAAADAGKHSIQATGKQSIEFIREHFDCAGLYIGAELDLTEQVTNYGKRTDDTVEFKITTPNHLRWNVANIQQKQIEGAWCLEVEEDHSFILRGGIPTGNCCLIDLKEMLDNGFKMGNADIETPKSIATACAVTSQIIAQVASHQYGGVSLNRLDEVLAPYVDKSYRKHLSTGKKWMSHDKAVVYATDMTRKEVHDGCQAMEYEINTLFTSQGQSPFVTFGFGLGTSWQAREIQKGILSTRIKGLGKQGRTAIFPKLVFMMDENVNMEDGDPNYDIKKLAITCASKRNYPDVLNMPRLRETGNGCAPMGCRSFLHKWHHPETGEEVWDGRNNLGVVSINLPKLGIISNTEDEFWANLDVSAKIAKKALLARIERLRGVKAKSAPILYMEGALGHRLEAEDDIMQIFENGRSSISLGYIGINEMCNAFMGTHVHIFDSESKQRFGQKVVRKLKEYTEEWKRETGWAFGLYSTPSESLCDRFCRLDRNEYGVIEGVTDREYYTNSFHLDVEKKVSPMSKIDFEAPYHHDANSGHITYVEVPNIGSKQQELLETYIETVWDYAANLVSYYGTNGVIDYCHDCKSECDAIASEEGYKCPYCGNSDSTTLEVTKRVCGYLGNPSSRPFIRGKQREVMGRVKHST